MSKAKRWFQWRLSTWFVLVAILAWALIHKPYVIPAAPLPPDPMFLAKGVNSGATLSGRLNVDRKLNPALMEPCIALLAFIAWKVAWRVLERSREKPAVRKTMPAQPPMVSD